MTADEIVTDIRAVLEEERSAVRRLDAQGVVRTTATKATLFARLQDTAKTGSPEDKQAIARALKTLREDLRYNLILLAHARDTLREVVEITRPRIEAKL